MEDKISHIKVSRNPSAKDWTLSTFLFDDIKKGVGVEDEKRDVKVKGETRIDNNTYIMALRNSPRFSAEYYRDDNGNLILAKQRNTPQLQAQYHTAHEMIWVKDVPNFEFILWHWGNTDLDTDGCYIVGSSFGVVNGRDGVIGSRTKYLEIYPIIWRSIKFGKTPVTVEYCENWNA